MGLLLKRPQKAPQMSAFSSELQASPWRQPYPLSQRHPRSPAPGEGMPQGGDMSLSQFCSVTGCFGDGLLIPQAQLSTPVLL